MRSRTRAVMLAATLVGLAAGVSCRVDDFRTVTIATPGVTNAVGAEIVRAALVREEREPGMRGSIKTDSIRVDFTNRTVTVTYDSMRLALKNLEHYVAAAGFTANDTPADPAAASKLPPECR